MIPRIFKQPAASFLQKPSTGLQYQDPARKKGNYIEVSPQRLTDHVERCKPAPVSGVSYFGAVAM